MRREREAALRMIRRSQSVQTPQGFRQRAISELIALAPPAVPRVAKIFVARSALTRNVCRQQPAHAQQPRLHLLRREPPIAKSRAQLADALHWPDVLFVAQ